MSRLGVANNYNFNAIQTEFGGSNPISLNEYYRSTWNTGTGVIVPPYPGQSGGQDIPASGQISLSQFGNSKQGVKIDCNMMGQVWYADPYYDISVLHTSGTFFSPVNIHINSSQTFNVVSFSATQNFTNGEVFDNFHAQGNHLTTTGTIVNHLNGRTRTLSSAIYKSYDSLNNRTYLYWLAGTEVDGVGTAGGLYPNDGISTFSLFGNPLGFYSSSFSPSFNGTFVPFSIFLSFYS